MTLLTRIVQEESLQGPIDRHLVVTCKPWICVTVQGTELYEIKFILLPVFSLIYSWEIVTEHADHDIVKWRFIMITYE